MTLGFTNMDYVGPDPSTLDTERWEEANEAAGGASVPPAGQTPPKPFPWWVLVLAAATYIYTIQQ